MPDPVDQTDGTPEWFKRLSKRWSQFGVTLAIAIFVFGFPFLGFRQLYNGFVHDTVWIGIRNSGQWVQFDREPLTFLFGIACAVFILTIWGFGLAIYHRVRRIPPIYRRQGH